LVNALFSYRVLLLDVWLTYAFTLTIPLKHLT